MIFSSYDENIDPLLTYLVYNDLPVESYALCHGTDNGTDNISIERCRVNFGMFLSPNVRDVSNNPLVFSLLLS